MIAWGGNYRISKRFRHWKLLKLGKIGDLQNREAYEHKVLSRSPQQGDGFIEFGPWGEALNFNSMSILKNYRENGKNQKIIPNSIKKTGQLCKYRSYYFFIMKCTILPVVDFR